MTDLTKYADMIEQLASAWEAQAAMPDTHMEAVVLPEARRLVAQARRVGNRPLLSAFPVGRRFKLHVDGEPTTGVVLRHSWLDSQHTGQLALLLQLESGRKRRVLWYELEPIDNEETKA